MCSEACSQHHERIAAVSEAHSLRAAADEFIEIQKGFLRNYRQFISVIDAFRRHYNLEKYSLREIDIFLWLAGKELFPRKY
jgi:hypothetical protein